MRLSWSREMFAQLLFHPSSTKHHVFHPITESVPIKYCFLRQPFILLLEQPPQLPISAKVFASESKNLRWQLQGWLLWRLSGQFSKKDLAQKHWMPLKSILLKESQMWLIGKETAGGIWWPPSEIPINCFSLKTTYYSQGCHSTGIILHFYPSPHQSHPSFPSLTPSRGLNFPHKSLTSTKQPQFSSSVVTFFSISLLWTLCGSQVQFSQAPWTSGCAAPSTPCPARAGTFPVQTHLAVKPQGMERSPHLRRPYLTYRKWRKTHHLFHRLYCS